MDFFDDIFKKLFPKRNKTIPILKENLKRSEKEELEFLSMLIIPLNGHID